MRIDAHAHFYPERFLDLIERQGDKHPVEVRRAGAGGERKLIVAGREFFTFLPDFSTWTSAWSRWPPPRWTCRFSPWARRWCTGRSPNSALSFAARSTTRSQASSGGIRINSSPSPPCPFRTWTPPSPRNGGAPLLKTLQTSFAWFGKNAAGEAKKMQYDKGFRITKDHVAPQFLEAALKKLGK